MKTQNNFVNKFLSSFLIYTLIFNVLGVFFLHEVTSANDADGSAHLNMVMAPSISSSSVVGKNFAYSVSLTNSVSSDGDGFKYGFILQLPANVNFESSDLGTPDRSIVHNSGSTLVFFRTNSPLLKGLTKNHTFSLNTSSGAIGTTKTIQVLGYANDNIYGVGKPPVGSPPSTLTGGIDFANSTYYTGSTTFPDNIIASSDISSLPFTGATINILPFDISKSESSSSLVGDSVTSTITITNNNLGALKNINIQDVVPANRKFLSFTNTGGVGSTNVTYNSPTAGKTKLDFNNIYVATGATLSISYSTLLLSHNLLSSESGSIIFDDGSYTTNGIASLNQAIPHTGGLASGALASTWNNGIGDLLINETNLPGTKTATTNIYFANISKSVDKGTSAIGDVLTYTIDVDVSDEFDLLSTGDSSYINDIIPDGMTFSGVVSSSIITGTGTEFSLSGTSTSVDGDTAVRWSLPSGIIAAGSKARVVYQTVIDGNFELAGPTHYVNNDSLTNTATLTYKVGGNNSGNWGNTEPTLVDQTYTDSASATTRALAPIMNKQLVKVVVPGVGTFDSSNPLGANDKITVGSQLTFAISANFPNVYFTGINIKDALPLLAGPNTSVYNIAFQTGGTLHDMSGSVVLMNDADGDGNPDNSFNGLTLSGASSVGNNPWLTTSDPNYINFNLGSGNGGNSFSILFTVDILPTAPDTIDTNGLHPLLNVATGEYRNYAGTLYADLYKEVPFTIAIPKLNISKTASGSNISYGKQVDYTVTIINSGAAPAFADNIIDSMPANMSLDIASWSIMYSGGLSNITNSDIYQSGTGLFIQFGTGTLGSSRSLVPNDNTGTPTIKENIVVIKYTLKPTIDFINSPNTNINTVALDYYATALVPGLEVNNYGPISASASFTGVAASLNRVLQSTTNTGSTGSGLYVGEDVTFRTTISLSGGTYPNSSFNDIRTATFTGQLDFLTGTVISTGPSLTFSSGTSFSTTSTGVVNFGNIINSNSGASEDIVLETTYRVKTGATSGIKNSDVRFVYSSTNLDATNPVNVLLPTFTITKTSSGSSLSYGNQADYTVTINNTGLAPGYAQNILDSVPANMTFDSGSWSVVYSGALVASGNIANSNIVQNGTGLTIEFGTGYNSSSRSRIPLNDTSTSTIKENIVVIKYTLRPTVNFIIGSPATRTNTVSLTYYAIETGGNAIGPISASSNVTVAVPAMTRILSSTSESDSTGSNLYIGEDATFDTTITLSGGTYLTGYFIDSVQDTTMLNFLSGSLIGYSGSLIFNTGATFTASGRIDFGTIVNTDNTPSTKETIVLRTTYKLKTNATAQTNRTSTGTFYYSSTNIAAGSTLNYRLPITNILKTASGSLLDAGDVITYTIKLTNTSTTAHGYDYALTDVLPSGIDLVPGTLTGNIIYSGSESDIFSGSGIMIDVLNPNNGSGTFTYNAIVGSGAVAGSTKINTVNYIMNTLPEDNSPYEKSYTGTTNVSISIKDASVSHIISATDLTDTTSAKFNVGYPDVAIGEEVTYDIFVTLAQLNYSGATLTQTLPTGLRFTSGSIFNDLVVSHSLSAVTLSGNTQAIFDFGNISNLGGAGTGFVLRTKAVLIDNAANTAGSVKNSTVIFNYDSGNSKTNNTPNFDVVEPNITITKVYGVHTGDGGDIVPTTITVTNGGSVPAYDLIISDYSPAHVTPGSGYYSATGVTSLDPGASIFYTYNTVLDNTVTYGELLTGTASVDYTSYPLVPINGERSYSGTDADNISIVGLSGLSKSLLTSDTVKIADKVSYRIAFPVPEGVTDNVIITDKTATGLVIIPGSVNITTSNGVTYSGSVSPNYNITSTSIGTGSAHTLTYAFTGISNTDTDNAVTEFIYINYDTVVVNSSDNNSGDSKTAGVTAVYNNGTTTLTATPLPVTVKEPNITLSINKTYTQGHSADISFTVTNVGNTGAYDVSIDSLMTSGLSFTGNITLTNSGGEVNLIRSGNTFNIDYLPANSGDPLIFKIGSVISNSIPDGQTLYLTGNLTYTSQPFAYSQLISNSLDTERNGTNIGPNDYFTSANTSLLSTFPILNEYISVNKPSGVIGDGFRYTITLANSGSVNLTAINVNLDISDSFTGFSVNSIPVGSTNNSNSTGGVNAQGQLNISGISILMGQTKTIVYDVYAKTTVVGGTIVNTIANVSDTPELATGGTPSVPVTIYAPVFTVTAHETDDNAGVLYNDETITHNVTLNNVGTSSGINDTITIRYNTGFTYYTGSLAFMTGSYVNTGTINVDDTTKTIAFTLDSMTAGTGETLTFKTVATGPIGSINKTTVNLIDEQGPSATGSSNELIIVGRPSGGGGGGGAPSILNKDSCPNGDYSSSYYDGTCGTKPTSPTPAPTPTPAPIPPQETPKKPDVPKDNTQKNDKSLQDILNELTSIYKSYQEKQKRLDDIYNSEKTKGIIALEKMPAILPKTGTPIAQRTHILKNNKLDTVPDSKDFVNKGIYKDDVNYRKSVLPAVDKNVNELIVTPSNGMVVPLVYVDKFNKDYKQLISGGEIDVNKYLKGGALKYPGTGTNGFGEVGNPVIFGHSSYFKTDNGRYKTQLQKIIELDKGEQIWIYKKNQDGSYKRFVYIVEKSYNVKPSQVDILDAGVGKNLTLFTCTPVGNLTGRWVIKAKFFDSDKLALETELYGKDVSEKDRNTFAVYINDLSLLTRQQRAKKIVEIYRTLDTDKIKKLFSTKSINYFKLLLAKEIFKK